MVGLPVESPLEYIMCRPALFCGPGQPLSAYHLGAVLIRDEMGLPSGMVSKTDLVHAFRQGVAPDPPAETIMTAKVAACEEKEYLEIAIQKMILAEVQRLWVYKGTPAAVSGVRALSDTARLRSGSCHACVTRRIRIVRHSTL